MKLLDREEGLPSQSQGYSEGAGKSFHKEKECGVQQDRAQITLYNRGREKECYNKGDRYFRPIETLLGGVIRSFRMGTRKSQILRHLTAPRREKTGGGFVEVLRG